METTSQSSTIEMKGVPDRVRQHILLCVDRILLSNSENVNVKNWIFRLSVFPVSLTLLSRSLTTVWGSVPANIHGQGSSSRWRHEGLDFKSCPGDTSTFLIVAMKYDALYTFNDLRYFNISSSCKCGVRALYTRMPLTWVQNIIMILL